MASIRSRAAEPTLVPGVSVKTLFRGGASLHLVSSFLSIFLSLRVSVIVSLWRRHLYNSASTAGIHAFLGGCFVWKLNQPWTFCACFISQYIPYQYTKLPVQYWTVSIKLNTEDLQQIGLGIMTIYLCCIKEESIRTPWTKISPVTKMFLYPPPLSLSLLWPKTAGADIKLHQPE